jgi:hypothetical protein
MGSELVRYKDSAGNDTLLSLSHITVGIEQQFVSFAKMKLLDESRKFLGSLQLQSYISYLCSGKEFWNEGSMSDGVIGVFQSDEGTKHLVRLCFGEAIKNLTHADFDKLYETIKDETSSLYQAFTLVMKKRFPELEEHMAEKKSVGPTVTPDPPDTVSSSPN